MTIFNPYLWLGIALACLLSFFGGCSVQKERSQRSFDQHLEADKAATEAFNAESKAKDAAQAQAIAQIGFRYEREKADALEAQDRVIADLRSGALRVRKQWRCDSPSLPNAPAAASGSDEGAELREADIGRVHGIGESADAEIRALQAVIRSYTQP